jgi:hypothetical protein
MFATIYLPNFYLQAAVRHQPPYRATAVPAVGFAGILPALLDPADETSVCPTDKMSVPQPVALIDEKDAKAVIIQLNEAAEKADVRKGMTPSQGLARCLNLIIKTRSHSQEKLLDEILLQHAFRLAPYVEATAPGVCTIQFTDNRGLASKVSRVIEQLAECEITAQAGIAHLPDASFLAAHLARPVLQIDDAKQFLAALPIETLAIALN